MKIRRRKKKKNKPEGFDGEPQDRYIDTEGSPSPGIKEQADGRAEFFSLSSKEEIKEYQPSRLMLDSRRARREYGRYFKFVPFIVLAAIVAGAVAFFWPSSTVKVPELAGKSIGEAMEIARDAGFKPGIDGWEYSGGIEDGVVISQKPGANKDVKKDDRSVLLTVSKGPAPELGSDVAPPGSRSDIDHTGVESTGDVICLDPGHQDGAELSEWVDPGKSSRKLQKQGVEGTVTGKPEYEITLEIALKCKDLLEKDGIQVVMTRETSDILLSNIDRAEIANNASADLYVRVHCAYSQDPEMSGTATLYPSESRYNTETFKYGKAAAIFMQSELSKACETRDLGIFAREDNSGLNWSRSPAVEVEVAYLSNTGEDKLLSEEEFQWKAAWGIRNGIRKYLENR
ncbi:MAG: N-acetylmuramoyl-L-alanine amidase [Actinobacteria bacterium]|nr:N-acetylmuramoyl-L-alanine amidase [Actinomycetota bacterium]